MKFNRIRKIAAIAFTMSVLVTGTALASWQYYENGPIACWTNTETGQQVFVYAGQPAPDGTPAPTVHVNGNIQSMDPVASANAAADAAKAARGGNVSMDATAEAAALRQASQAANANSNTNTVAVVTKAFAGNSKSSHTNATLPTIRTEVQNQTNQANLNSGTYTSPSGTKSTFQNITTISSGAVSGDGTSGYYVGSGHYVTNAGEPTVGTNISAVANTVANAGSNVSNAMAQNTTAQNVTANANTAGAQNYSGTLPNTGSQNVVTQRTLQSLN